VNFHKWEEARIKVIFITQSGDRGAGRGEGEYSLRRRKVAMGMGGKGEATA